MTPEGFEAWAETSRAGFVEQQVAAGLMLEAEAAEYAERSFGDLFPEGRGTPGQHVWTVHDGDTVVGHLWIRITLQSDGLDAFLFEVALFPEARGRGLGRATMLAAESQAREMGATRMRLNVFGHNTVARGLYRSLGYQVTSTNMVRRLDTTSPMTYDGGPTVSLEPMTQPQFDTYLAAAENHYAANIADSGMLPRDEARQKSVDDFARLLPKGLQTHEHFLWTARQGDGDREVGMVWLNIAAKSDGPHAFGYDFSVREELRRHGYGRSIMVAAEQICRDRGVVSVGLNVFGFNLGAQSLYEQMGFEVSAQLLKKQL
jgi:ribosomal protein S18 acetylase RimI-like enzyme